MHPSPYPDHQTKWAIWTGSALRSSKGEIWTSDREVAALLFVVPQLDWWLLRFRQGDALGEQLRVYRVTLTLRKHAAQYAKHPHAFCAMRFGVALVDIDFNALLIGNALNEFQNREEIRFMGAKLSGEPTVLPWLKVGDDVAVVAVVDRGLKVAWAN